MRHHVRGFTLVELLVVIAIIGVLVALLLPAVQAAREAARRTTCLDHLKNLGLACLNHLDARKTYPPGKVLRRDANPTEELTNWAIEILPYIEEGALYDRYDQTRRNWDNVNKLVLQTTLPVMGCPSDPNVGRLAVPQNGPTFGSEGLATGSYRAVGGRGLSGGNPDEMYWDSMQATMGDNANQLNREDRGAMHMVTRFNLSPVRAGQITDGASHTLLIGEYTANRLVGRSVYWANSFYGMNLGSIVPNVGSHFWTPDYETCRVNMPDPGFPQPCRRAFSSMHGGSSTVNFVYCDGAVRSINTDVNMTVMANTATISGRETQVVIE
jgi:prepilin-type N-terminal cleavage/methylation domain-containing protein/prepilin-type processing-associated H-X9-DG protein